MAATAKPLQLLLVKLTFDVDACASCNDTPTVLEQLVSDIKTNAVVTTDQPQTIDEWLMNAFTVFTILIGKDVIYQEGFQGVQQNCALFQQALGGPPPRCEQAIFNIRIVLTDASIVPPLNAISAPIVRALSLAPPRITMPPDLTGEKGLCALPPPNTTFPALTGPTTALLDLGSGVATVQITSACGTWLPLLGVSATDARDCAGNVITGEQSDAACQRYEILLTLPSQDCAGANAAGSQLIDVVVGGPCFQCPADECALESRDVKEALDAAVKRGCRSIKRAGVRNGCGRKLNQSEYSIAYADKRVCDRCCRGEVVVERTWTVQDKQCDVSASCVQQLRVVNPCWQKYFPSTCECLCGAADGSQQSTRCKCNCS